MNKLRYLMADFDNYRKRTERQIESKINQGKAELILKFVSIHDDLFRAIETAKQVQIRSGCNRGFRRYFEERRDFVRRRRC